MPGIRGHREFTEKQQIALNNRQKNRKAVYGPLLDPGAVPTPVGPLKRNLDKVLNHYLIVYDARLLEIDHKYPLGDPDRPEWLEVHRKNGVKRIQTIIGGKGLVV